MQINIQTKIQYIVILLFVSKYLILNIFAVQKNIKLINNLLIYQYNLYFLYILSYDLQDTQ